MKNWIVSWSEDGIFWSQKQMKTLEDYDSAVWFAKPKRGVIIMLECTKLKMEFPEYGFFERHCKRDRR